MKIGIVGLPNVGKSTLFQTLTKKQVDISNYPFCTIEPNVGVVAVPDQRLLKIAELIKPEKITPAVIEFIDIAGLVQNAHQGEGLGNQFLSYIREVDLICHIVRCFKDETIVHIEGKIDPQRDVEIINLELIMKDLEIIQKKIEKTAATNDEKKLENLEKLKTIKKWLEQGKLIQKIDGLEKFQEIIKELQLLTAKPQIYIMNINASEKIPSPTENADCIITLSAQNELELSDLTADEIKELDLEPSKLDQLIAICYDILKLNTFYTIVGGKEMRAWSIPKETKAAEAALRVHTDFGNFVRAEVINWQTLINAGSWPAYPASQAGGQQAWQKAREKGLIRTEGKNYIVQDGDVIEFKI